MLIHETLMGSILNLRHFYEDSWEHNMRSLSILVSCICPFRCITRSQREAVGIPLRLNSTHLLRHRSQVIICSRIVLSLHCLTASSLGELILVASWVRLQRHAMRQPFRESYGHFSLIFGNMLSFNDRTFSGTYELSAITKRNFVMLYLLTGEYGG